MFSSISESIFGTSGSPKGHVNMDRGSTNTSARKTKNNNQISEIKLIESLKNELKIKDAAINALSAKVERLEDQKSNSDLTQVVKRRHHPVITESNIIDDNDGRQKVKMGTRGSILTSNILLASVEVQKTSAQSISEKFLEVFRDPTKHISYLSSKQFANDLIEV